MASSEREDPGGIGRVGEDDAQASVSSPARGAPTQKFSAEEEKAARSDPKTAILDPTDLPQHASPSSSSSRRFLPRTIGEFEILTTLGEGGMGTVYMAYEPLLDRLVALKLLASGPQTESMTREAVQFLSEVVLTGKLTHAGIIPVYHVGYDADHGYYYTMRYVEGMSLGDILHGISRKDPGVMEAYGRSRLLTLFERVCEAVGFAHRNGILHRDLKPANIMVTEFSEVFVLDWGLAKEMKDSEDNSERRTATDSTSRLKACRRKRDATTRIFLALGHAPPQKRKSTSFLKQLKDLQPDPNEPTPHGGTPQSIVAGTPGYASPEQVSGDKDLKPASDVYSLGVILYEILTGALPVEINFSDPMDTIVKTATGEITPIEKQPAAVGLPRILIDIVNRAIGLKPEQRFRHAGEMAEELSLYLGGKATLKEIARDAFEGRHDPELWEIIGTEPKREPNRIVLREGGAMRCRKQSLGDLRGRLRFGVPEGHRPWSLTMRVCERLDDEQLGVRYEVRIGANGRSFVELIRLDRRVQRVFDVQLDPEQEYQLRIDMDGDTVRIFLDHRKLIEYAEHFPQTGGAIELACDERQVRLRRFELTSRGAPLHLSFMFLPDRLFRQGKYAEAKELYLQLAASHPGREEGLLARYKAGLCCAELDDTQTAFDEFSRLEGTMYEHCCALGIARVSMKEGSVDWAWEALRTGYQNQQSDRIKAEIWFSLLGLIEHLDAPQVEDKLTLYRELLADLDPPVEEQKHLVFEMLELALKANGPRALRKEAGNLLEKHPRNISVITEVLLGLSKVGMADDAVPQVERALARARRYACPEPTRARFQLLRGEISLGAKQLEEAEDFLLEAITLLPPFSADAWMAHGWIQLSRYLRGAYEDAIRGARDLISEQSYAQREAVTYLKLVAALACFGADQQQEAQDTLQDAARSECPWGALGRHIQQKAPADSLAEIPLGNNQHRLAEGLFLAGETLAFLGLQREALEHYDACLEESCERTLIAPFARHRKEDFARYASPGS